MKHLYFYQYFLLVAVLAVLLFNACDISNDEILSDQQIIEKIKGEWTVQETSVGQTSSSFEVTIAAATENKYIIVYNFNHLGTNISVKGEITEHSITFAKQTTSDGYIVQGYGLINTSFSKITLDYSVDDGSGTVVNYEDILTR
jgi:hypothetical protein